MDNVVFVAAAVIGALATLVTLVVSRPSAMARRGPNPAIGIRTSETMRDAGTWNATHDAAWPWLRAARRGHRAAREHHRRRSGGLD